MKEKLYKFPKIEILYVSESPIPMPQFSDIFSDPMRMVAAVRHGLPWSEFQKISQEAPFTEAEWAEILDISGKTLQRYRSDVNHRFSPLHSEKILQIGEVMHRGAEVFSGKERFGAWLRTPCFALAGEQPIKLIGNAYGKDLVMAELVRIDHGILS